MFEDGAKCRKKDLNTEGAMLESANLNAVEFFRKKIHQIKFTEKLTRSLLASTVDDWSISRKRSDPSWEFSGAGSEFAASWKSCSLVTKSCSIPINVFKGPIPMSLENCPREYDMLATL